jgi:hypothetical protein
MDRVVVATVQQQMRVFEKQEDYQEDVYRYMRLARPRVPGSSSSRRYRR